MLNQGGDLDIGLKDYLMFDGFSSRLVPFKNKLGSIQPGKVDTDQLYHLMTEVFSWDALKRDDYFVDYQNLITHLGVLSQRSIFVNAANAFIKAQEYDRALEMLDKCQECVPAETYPLETVCIGFTGNDYMVIAMVDDYLTLGQRDKGLLLAAKMADALTTTARFYMDFYPYEKQNFETCVNYIYYLVETLKSAGEMEFAKEVEDNLKQYTSSAGKE